MYIQVRFGRAVFIKKHFGTSSVISDQAAMYICSLVSVFCCRQFSVKQLNLKFTSFYVNIFNTVFLRGLKIKHNLVKLTFRTAISSHQVMGMLSKKCEV